MLPCIEVRLEKSNIDFCQNFERFWDRAALVDYSDPSGRLDDKRRTQLIQTAHEIIRRNLPVTPSINPADIQNLKVDDLFNALSPLGRIFFRARIPSNGPTDGEYQHLKNLNVEATSRGLTVGIILDFGCTPVMESINLSRLEDLIRRVNDLQPNSIYVASGAYPGTLKDVGQGSTELDRLDWQLWKRIAASLPGIALGFSDYASVCPTWTEDVRMRGGPLAIRYAVDDHWLIVRGGADKGRQEAKNLAQLFFEVFDGRIEPRGFSAGDRNIYNKADPFAPSSAQKLAVKDHVWEALSHHISFVVKKQYQDGQAVPKSGHAIF